MSLVCLPVLRLYCMIRSRQHWPRVILFLACRTADLKKECAEKGLSDEGDDETLRWRLAHFDDHDMEWLKHHEEKAVAAIKIKTERERKQSEKDVWIEKWAKMRSVSLHLLCYKCKCTVCASTWACEHHTCQHPASIRAAHRVRSV